MTSINERIKRLIDELTANPVEDRVVEHIVREVHAGRTIAEVLDDPYVKNRLNESQRAAILENSEVLGALEAEIKSAFQAPE